MGFYSEVTKYQHRKEDKKKQDAKSLKLYQIFLKKNRSAHIKIRVCKEGKKEKSKEEKPFKSKALFVLRVPQQSSNN